MKKHLTTNNQNIMRIFKTLLFIALCLSTSACTNSVQKLDDFVSKTEANCEDYDTSDWKKSIREFEQLVQEYRTSDRDFSEAEKQMAARAMGRYHALLLQHGIKLSADYINVLKAMLPPYLEGLLDGIDENSSEMEKSLDGHFDLDALEKKAEVLEEKLERLFGGGE